MNPENKTANLSVANVILAVLWKMGEGNMQTIMAHNYSKACCMGKNRITFRSSISRLKKQGLIANKIANIYVLTEKGRSKAPFSFIKVALKMQKKEEMRWDGGWRMIFFDIPESKKKFRDYLRHTLKAIGFKELQRSIWVYPFPVPAFLKELLFEERIKPHARFVTTDYLEDDAELKRLFKLA